VIWGLTGTLCSPCNPSITNIASALLGHNVKFNKHLETHAIDEIFLKKFAIKARPASRHVGERSWTVTESTVNLSLPPRLQCKYDQVLSELWEREWALSDKLAINRLHKVAAGFYGVNVPPRKVKAEESSRKRKMPDTLYEDTECPICMEPHTQPMVIQCGHSFCKHCIDTWKGQQSQGNRQKCPICRTACDVDPVPMHMVKIRLEPVAIAEAGESSTGFDPYRISAAMELIAGSEKIVVFSQYKDVLTSLGKELAASKISYVDMSHPTWTRDSVTFASSLTFFETTSECKVILLNTRTHSTGLNLTSANSVLFMERPTDSTWYTQGVGRVDRQGQTRDVTVHVLMTDIPDVAY
jgi:hypothetical protein